MPPAPSDAAAASAQRSSAAGGASGGLCPICLEPVSDEAYLDHCFHRFCLACIQLWSAASTPAAPAKGDADGGWRGPVCPLCKTHYTSVIHNFSGHDFERTRVCQAPGSPDAFALSDIQRQRRALYLQPGSALADGQVSTAPGGKPDLPGDQGREELAPPPRPRIRRTSPGEQKRWLRCWIRRELQALMLVEDVDVVALHVIGVIETLLPRPGKKTWIVAPQAGLGWREIAPWSMASFVFEHAERFEEELRRFLASEMDIAVYDAATLGAPGAGPAATGRALPTGSVHYGDGVSKRILESIGKKAPVETWDTISSNNACSTKKHSRLHDTLMLAEVSIGKRRDRALLSQWRTFGTYLMKAMGREKSWLVVGFSANASPSVKSPSFSFAWAADVAEVLRDA
eukprot:SM000012S25445  [mRNA]  locus=s12:1141783:1148567:- [translate_table: standard]